MPVALLAGLRHAQGVHMNRTDTVRELAARSGVSEREAGNVLDALIELLHQGSVSGDVLLSPEFSMPSSDAPLVDDLIARARLHPLGVEFLRDGYLGSVAAEFGAHALTVEAARGRLRNEQTKKGNA